MTFTKTCSIAQQFQPLLGATHPDYAVLERFIADAENGTVALVLPSEADSPVIKIIRYCAFLEAIAKASGIEIEKVLSAIQTDLDGSPDGDLKIDARSIEDFPLDCHCGELERIITKILGTLPRKDITYPSDVLANMCLIYLFSIEEMKMTKRRVILQNAKNLLFLYQLFPLDSPKRMEVNAKLQQNIFEYTAAHFYQQLNKNKQNPLYESSMHLLESTREAYTHAEVKNSPDALTNLITILNETREAFQKTNDAFNQAFQGGDVSAFITNTVPTFIKNTNKALNALPREFSGKPTWRDKLAGAIGVVVGALAATAIIVGGIAAAVPTGGVSFFASIPIAITVGSIIIGASVGQFREKGLAAAISKAEGATHETNYLLSVIEKKDTEKALKLLDQRGLSPESVVQLAKAFKYHETVVTRIFNEKFYQRALWKEDRLSDAQLLEILKHGNDRLFETILQNEKLTARVMALVEKASESDRNEVVKALFPSSAKELQEKAKLCAETSLGTYLFACAAQPYLAEPEKHPELIDFLFGSTNDPAIHALGRKCFQLAIKPKNDTQALLNYLYNKPNKILFEFIRTLPKQAFFLPTDLKQQTTPLPYSVKETLYTSLIRGIRAGTTRFSLGSEPTFQPSNDTNAVDAKTLFTQIGLNEAQINAITSTYWQGAGSPGKAILNGTILFLNQESCTAEETSRVFHIECSHNGNDLNYKSICCGYLLECAHGTKIQNSEFIIVSEIAFKEGAYPKQTVQLHVFHPEVVAPYFTKNTTLEGDIVPEIRDQELPLPKIQLKNILTKLDKDNTLKCVLYLLEHMNDDEIKIDFGLFQTDFEKPEGNLRQAIIKQIETLNENQASRLIKALFEASTQEGYEKIKALLDDISEPDCPASKILHGLKAASAPPQPALECQTAKQLTSAGIGIFGATPIVSGQCPVVTVGCTQG